MNPRTDQAEEREGRIKVKRQAPITTNGGEWSPSLRQYSAWLWATTKKLAPAPARLAGAWISNGPQGDHILRKGLLKYKEQKH